MCLDSFARALVRAVVVGVGVAVGLPGQTVLTTIPLQAYGDDQVLLIGDVDGTGVRDLAIERVPGGLAAHSVEIYSSRTGALLHQFLPPPGHSYGSLSWVGDVNGDGIADICFYVLAGSASGHVIRSGVDGSLLHHIANAERIYGLDDVNGDGKDDLLLSDPGATVNGILQAGRVDVVDGATLAILWSHFGWQQDQGLGGGPVLGDIDGDGKRDYVIGSSGIWWGQSGANGAPLFTLQVGSPTSSTSSLTDVGDFNADGYDDIVFVEVGGPPMGPYRWVRVLAGPAMTQELWSYLWMWANPTPWYGRILGRLGDIDGDGFADLGIQGGDSWLAVSSVISGRNGSNLLVSPLAQAAIWPELGSPGDANGDGFLDFFAPTSTGSATALFSGAPAGVQTIGPGCPSLGVHTPQLGVSIGARLGRTLGVNLREANPNSLAILGGGFSNQQWNGAPLPFGLGVLGLPWCSWHIAADLTLAVATTANPGLPHHAQLALPVPNAPSLAQAELFWQWFVLEPSGPGAPGAVTAAVRTTVLP
jgi:hypothetical protein